MTPEEILAAELAELNAPDRLLARGLEAPRYIEGELIDPEAIGLTVVAIQIDGGAQTQLVVYRGDQKVSSVMIGGAPPLPPEPEPIEPDAMGGEPVLYGDGPPVVG